MKYYRDNVSNSSDVRMIRVHTDADESSREWFFAKSEIRHGDGTWYGRDDSELQIEILHSGYMWPCDENGVFA